MSNLKKYLFQLLITSITIIIFLLLITTLYYFNLITATTYNILKMILIVSSIFINSFILGKKTPKRGYLEGIKLTIPIIIIFSIITLIKKLFTPRILLYYLILVITGILGSMIGISRKKEL